MMGRVLQKQGIFCAYFVSEQQKTVLQTTMEP